VSCFPSRDGCIENEDKERNKTAYIQNWISKLEEDNRLIVQAPGTRNEFNSRQEAQVQVEPYYGSLASGFPEAFNRPQRILEYFRLLAMQKPYGN
jgi:hypothetical protein